LKDLNAWTYILHEKNNIVKDLMKAFLDSHGIESHLQKLYANLNENEFVIFKIHNILF
jgi:hypothetical protein